MSLTQYLQSQEDQDITRLLNFLELKRVEDERFLYLGMKERGGLYSSDGENMNGMSFNEG